MTAATEQQARPLLAHLEAAGYRHHPGGSSDLYETGDEASALRVVVWRTAVHVWKPGMPKPAKFPEGFGDEEIVAALEVAERGLRHG